MARWCFIFGFLNLAGLSLLGITRSREWKSRENTEADEAANRELRLELETVQAEREAAVQKARVLGGKLRQQEERAGKAEAALRELRKEVLSKRPKQTFVQSNTTAVPPVFGNVFGWASGGKESTLKGCTKPQAPKMVGLVTRICCKSFPMEFNRCALVGGSADLDGKRLGREIDGHDTVIRVNRVPTEVYYEDFGNHTDVLFAGAVADTRPMYTWLGQFFRKMGGYYAMCEFASRTCPFKALILKGADSREFGLSWEARYPQENPGWKPKNSQWPLGYQTDFINDRVYDLVGGKRPTNGFHAFVTFAFMCNTLDVYGFTGAGTADGHWMSRKHNLELEHELQSQIVAGGITATSGGGNKTLDPEFVRHLQSLHGRVRVHR